MCTPACVTLKIRFFQSIFNNRFILERCVLEAALKAKFKGCWVCSFVEKYPEARLVVIDCKALERSKSVQHLFEIVAPPHLTNTLVKDIHSDPALYDVELISLKTGRVYGSIKIRNHVCGFAKMRGLHLKSAHSAADRTVEWNIMGDNRSFRQLMKELESEGVQTTVLKLKSFNGTTVLTAKQELILKMALEKGYFDYPKKTHLEDLAAITGTTPASLTEILRKGVRKVLTTYFSSGPVKPDTSRFAE